MNNYPNLDVAQSNHSKNSPSAIGCAYNDHQINTKCSSVTEVNL